MGRCGIKRQKFCHDIDSIGGVKSLFHAASELHTLCVVTAKSGEWSDTLLFHLLWECPRRGADLVKRNDSLSLSFGWSQMPHSKISRTPMQCCQSLMFLPAQEVCCNAETSTKNIQQSTSPRPVPLFSEFWLWKPPTKIEETSPLCPEVLPKDGKVVTKAVLLKGGLIECESGKDWLFDFAFFTIKLKNIPRQKLEVVKWRCCLWGAEMTILTQHGSQSCNQLWFSFQFALEKATMARWATMKRKNIWLCKCKNWKWLWSRFFMNFSNTNQLDLCSFCNRCLCECHFYVETKRTKWLPKNWWPAS